MQHVLVLQNAHGGVLGVFQDRARLFSWIEENYPRGEFVYRRVLDGSIMLTKVEWDHDFILNWDRRLVQ